MNYTKQHKPRKSPGMMGRSWGKGLRVVRAGFGDRGKASRRPQPHVQEPWLDPFDRFMLGLEAQARIEAHRLSELEL